MDSLLTVLFIAFFVWLSDKFGQKKKPPARKRPPENRRAPVKGKAPADEADFEIPPLQNAPPADDRDYAAKETYAAETVTYPDADELLREIEKFERTQQAALDRKAKTASAASGETAAPAPEQPAKAKPVVPPGTMMSAIMWAEILGRPRAYKRRPRYHH